jgi:methionyl-tRNA formyltransferase
VVDGASPRTLPYGRRVNVLVVAEESAGIQVVRMLAATEHRIVGVLTAPPTRGGGATVGEVASGLGLEVLPSERVRDPAFAAWVRGEQVDLLLNVHSLFVVAAEIVAAPTIGSFNLHPGPLPEYAGLNVPSWAIYNGEQAHGVTLHWMEAGIDTGPIAFDDRFPISDDETGLSLSVQCVRRGLPLIAALLDAAEAGRASIPATSQDGDARRYFGRNVPDDGRIVWSRPARRISAFVRACDYLPFASPWGHPTARLNGHEIAILRTTLTGDRASAEPGTVGLLSDEGGLVATADEWILVQRLKVEDAGVAPRDVLRAGARFEP